MEVFGNVCTENEVKGERKDFDIEQTLFKTSECAHKRDIDRGYITPADYNKQTGEKKGIRNAEIALLLEAALII